MVSGYWMQPQYTCINASLTSTNSSLSNYEAICVEGMTGFVAEEVEYYASDIDVYTTLQDGYNAVFPLSQPYVIGTYDDGYPMLDASSSLQSFPIQMWI